MKKMWMGIVVLAFALGACSQDKKNSNTGEEAAAQRLNSTATAGEGTGAVEATNPTSVLKAAGPETKGAPTAKRKSGRNPKVEVTTNMGVIVIELNAAKAPISVANFLQYVKSGHYSGTIFHRVIPSFMIQGGGFTESMQQKKTRGPIKNEADNGLKNTRGTVAMARTNVVDSATCQFFINTVDNGSLNHRSKTPRGWGYTVFGHVTQGMGVVDKIRAVRTGVKNRMPNVPIEPVIIRKARIL